jgi:hypothetical protein
MSKTLTLDFVENGQVTLTRKDGSTTTYDHSSGQQTITLNDNETIDLDATPDTGREFVEWQDGGGSQLSASNPYTGITMDSNKSITVVFQKQTFAVIIESETNGSVLVNGSETVSGGNNKNFTFTYGENVTLQANPNNPYQLNKWVDGSNSTLKENNGYYDLSPTNLDTSDVEDNDYTYTVNSDITIKAVFDLRRYYIKIMTEENGEVAVSWQDNDGTNHSQTVTETESTVGPIEHGTDVTDIQFNSLKDGYIIDKWMMDENVAIDNFDYYDTSGLSLVTMQYTETIQDGDNLKNNDQYNSYNFVRNAGSDEYYKADKFNIIDIEEINNKFIWYDSNDNCFYQSDTYDRTKEDLGLGNDFYTDYSPIVKGSITIYESNYNNDIDEYEYIDITDSITSVDYDNGYIQLDANYDSVHIDYTYISQNSDAYFHVRNLTNNFNYGILYAMTFSESFATEEPYSIEGYEFTYTYELKNPQYYNVNEDVPQIPSADITDDLEVNSLSSHIAISAPVAIKPAIIKIFKPGKDGVDYISSSPQLDQVYVSENNNDYWYGKFPGGTMLHLEARDGSKKEFTSWGSAVDESLRTQKNIDIELAGLTMIRPQYSPESYDINVIQPEHGEIILSEPLVVNNNDDCIKFATCYPDYGYLHTDWTGTYEGTRDGDGEVPTQIAFKTNEPKSFGVILERRQDMQLDLQCNNGLDPANCITLDNDKDNYEFGEYVTLEAIPPDGYEFLYWSGDVSMSDKTITIGVGGYENENYKADGQIDLTTTVKANFIELDSRQLTINTELSDGTKPTGVSIGLVSPFIGTKTIDELDDDVLSFKAEGKQNTKNDSQETSYTFQYWRENIAGRATNQIENYQFDLDLTTVSNSRTYTAVFERAECDLDLEKKILDNRGDLSNCTVVYRTSDGTEYSGIGNMPDDFKYNDELKLIAETQHGYKFKHWEEKGKIIGTNNMLETEIKGDRKIRAVFQLEQFELTINENLDQFDISVDPVREVYNGGEFKKIYKYDTTINIDVTLRNNRRFQNWVVDSDSIIADETSTSTTLTIKDTTELGISSDDETNDLTVISDNGTVSIDPNQTSFSTDRFITIKATPDQGYKFVRWDGDITNYDIETEIYIDRDMTIEAVYQTRPFPLTVQTKGEGYVKDVANDEKYTGNTYNKGETVDLKAIPLSVANKVYRFSRWEDEDGNELSTDANYTVTMDKEKVVVAIFEKVEDGVFDMLPTKILRNHRKNGPIESQKYNNDFNEIYYDLNLASDVNDEQSKKVAEHVLSFIQENILLKRKVREIEEKLKTIKNNVEGGNV